MTMNEIFSAARQSGAPLLAIRTADPAATIGALLPTIRALNEGGAETPVVQWDAARGITGVNKVGVDTLARVGIASAKTYGLVSAMDAASKLPGGTVLFAHNVHRQLHSQEPGVTAAAVQSVSNLRDLFKQDFRTWVAVGPGFRLPPFSYPPPASRQVLLVRGC